MKTTADLVGGWLKEGDSDLANASLCVSSGTSLDTACFHTQQASEKYLKAYMIAHSLSFPFIHNLEKLVDLCIAHDSSFATIKGSAASLTPYAVALRYDDEFWPTDAETNQAVDIANDIRKFIIDRLPAGMQPAT